MLEEIELWFSADNMILYFKYQKYYFKNAIINNKILCGHVDSFPYSPL